MFHQIRTFIFSLIFLGLGARGHAYVTSAVLEYCAADSVGFYLNGSQLLERSEVGGDFYRVLSTAEGTLPLELLKENEENVLGIKMFKIEKGGELSVSFRLTVYQSSGDPWMLWSETTGTKSIHLSKDDKDPEGWTERSFDDSKWGPVGWTLVQHADPKWIRTIDINPTFGWGRATLSDGHFGDFFGNGCVPYLVTTAQGLDRNLMRRRFSFPSRPSPAQLTISPASADYGQSVTVRLVPGPDSTELSRYDLTAGLPGEVELTEYATGARLDPKEHRISWEASNRDMGMGTQELHAQSVVSSGSWASPEKLLGPPKDGKDDREANIPNAVRDDGAIASSGPAWFKMDTPTVDASQGLPVIQGVLFRVRMRMGSTNSSGHLEADRMFFNYSIDGRDKGALKHDIDLAHTTDGSGWYDGYYHASEDRHWTWDDIKNLKVMFNCHRIGELDENLISWVTCVVSYYNPGLVAPWFKVKILEKDCAELQFQAAVSHVGSAMTRSNPVSLRVNEKRCVAKPSPVPTATAFAQSTPTPQPTATQVPAKAPQVYVGLGCLTMSPDPVDDRGSFISFCLKSGSAISVSIYDAATGKPLRHIAAAPFGAAASNQIFFNGLDDGGKMLVPGRYLCELKALKDGAAERRNTYFKMTSPRSVRGVK